MPTLLELQHAIARSLLRGDVKEASAFVESQGLTHEERLAIYRNTSAGVMVGALRLAFVAVQHVLGADFFEGAARLFVGETPPGSAWLDQYGADFPEFLARLPQTASIPYLGDLARLEWSVNIVLHAVEAPFLDIADLTGMQEADLAQLRLAPHPGVQLLRCDFPADAIWRAVLDRDDDAMAAIRLSDGPVWLLVQRTAKGIDLLRLSEVQWRIARELFLGQSLAAVVAMAPDAQAHAILATLLTRECFTTFSPAPESFARHTRRIHI